jgi:hypothetical protein
MSKITNGQYNQTKAVRQSHLKQILQSPAHYRVAVEKSEDYSESKAMLIGSAVHCAVLEPNAFAQRFIAIDGNRNSNAVKDAIGRAESLGLSVLKSEEMAEVYTMTNAINSHPQAGRLVQGGLVELGLSWHKDGVDYKCKPDLIRDDHIFVDLKTTRDASPRSFSRDFFDHGYDFQMEFYREGLAENGFESFTPAIVCVENVAPYNVMVYAIPEEVLQYGRKNIEKARKILKECIEKMTWPGYSTEIEEILIPYYLKNEINQY